MSDDNSVCLGLFQIDFERTSGKCFFLFEETFECDILQSSQGHHQNFIQNETVSVLIMRQNTFRSRRKTVQTNKSIYIKWASLGIVH